MASRWRLHGKLGEDSNFLYLQQGRMVWNGVRAAGQQLVPMLMLMLENGYGYAFVVR